MKPFGTPARISTQDEHWPFKSYPLFSVGQEIIQFINQVSTYTVINQVSTYDAVCKSVHHARLHQRLSRHQGITLELQGLYRKHLEFYD